MLDADALLGWALWISQPAADYSEKAPTARARLYGRARAAVLFDRALNQEASRIKAHKVTCRDA